MNASAQSAEAIEDGATKDRTTVHPRKREVWQLGTVEFDFADIAPDLPEGPERRGLVDAVARFLKPQIGTIEPTTLKNKFWRLSHILAVPALREAIDDESAAFLTQTHGHIRTEISLAAARAHAAVAREWYLWCATKNLPRFHPDAAILMEDLRIGMGRAGVAVKRLDPDVGPLSEGEEARFEKALYQAVRAQTLPATEAATGMLFFTLGCNPENLCRANEGDFLPAADGTATLMVPRIKKGNRDPRGELVARRLSKTAAQAVARVIADNAERNPPGGDPQSPLLRLKDGTRANPRGLLYNTIRLPALLGVLSDAGKTLRLHPRRLRYTFARRAVRNGATPQELMDLLDHSSIATCLVYYDPRFTIVDALDERLGPRLAPFADIAMGRRAAPPPLELPDRPWPLHGAPHACIGCSYFEAVAPRAVGAIADDLEGLADAFAKASLLREPRNRLLDERTVALEDAHGRARRIVDALASGTGGA